MCACVCVGGEKACVCVRKRERACVHVCEREHVSVCVFLNFFLLFFNSLTKHVSLTVVWYRLGWHSPYFSPLSSPCSSALLKFSQPQQFPFLPDPMCSLALPAFPFLRLLPHLIPLSSFLTLHTFAHTWIHICKKSMLRAPQRTCRVCYSWLEWSLYVVFSVPSIFLPISFYFSSPLNKMPLYIDVTFSCIHLLINIRQNSFPSYCTQRSNKHGWASISEAAYRLLSVHTQHCSIWIIQ